MKLTHLTLAFSLTATAAHAALSGFYDSAEQIGTILSSAEVADAVRQAPINDLSHVATRADGAVEWRIKTPQCELQVHLVPVPPKGVGKTTYQVEIDAAGCR